MTEKNEMPQLISLILMMLMYLIEVHTQQNMLGTAEYFKNMFNELAEFTKHLNHL